MKPKIVKEASISVYTDELTGRRYRIQPIREYFAHPNKTPTRQEMGELLMVFVHNNRVDKPWWRLMRVVAGIFGFKGIHKRLSKKGAIKIFVANK